MKRTILVSAIVALSTTGLTTAHLAPRVSAVRNGHAQTFWPNGHMKSDATYVNDAFEGEYRTWYASGAPYELRHYTAGHEAGVQRSWTEAGELYLNYEVRDGRRFGLVNATPCNTVTAPLVNSKVGELVNPDSPNQQLANSPISAMLPYYDGPQFTPRWTSVAHRIGSFQLVRQTGARVTDRDLAARVHVASFVYTSCAAVCPILIRQLGRVRDATDALIVSYSVTPDTDTPAALAEFGRARGIDPSRWWLVTGDRTQIYDLARRSYFADDDRAQGDAFLHTEKILLVDNGGHLRGVYNGTQPNEIDHLIADIRTLSQ